MPFLYTERQLRNEAEQTARDMGITGDNRTQLKGRVENSLSHRNEC